MKVKELQALLATKNQEAKVLVRLDGSIFATDSVIAHEDYNEDMSGVEVYILAVEDWPEGE